MARVSDLPLWRITQGTARATVRAADYAAAKDRGSYIGFKNPDSIVLVS